MKKKPTETKKINWKEKLIRFSFEAGKMAIGAVIAAIVTVLINWLYAIVVAMVYWLIVRDVSLEDIKERVKSGKGEEKS